MCNVFSVMGVSTDRPRTMRFIDNASSDIPTQVSSAGEGGCHLVAKERRCGVLLQLQLNRGTGALSFTQSVDGRVYRHLPKAGESITLRADNMREP